MIVLWDWDEAFIIPILQKLSGLKIREYYRTQAQVTTPRFILCFVSLECYTSYVK